MIKTRFAQTVLVIGVALGTVSIRSSAQLNDQWGCCRITAIDANSGVVTAKHPDTGAAFSFTFDSGSLPGTLSVGKRVWEDGGKVGLTAGQSCCTIIPAVLNAPALLGMKTSSSYRRSYSAEAPCCSIVSIDAKAGIVTVKVNATGNVFQFKPNSYTPVDGLRTNPVTLASLKPGQAVYANFTNHQVSLDGRTVWAGRLLLR